MIYRTLYVLDFIDHADLRQAVQKALNRSEACRRFRKTVAFVNTGAFRVKTEAEQALWNECSQLIANAVIFYNTALLSRIYEQKLTAGDTAAIEILRGISPVAAPRVLFHPAWAHLVRSSVTGATRSTGWCSRRSILVKLAMAPPKVKCCAVAGFSAL